MKNLCLCLSPTEFLLCDGGYKYFRACRALWKLKHLCRVVSGEEGPSQRRKNKLNKSSFCFPSCWCFRKNKQKNLKGVHGGTGAQFCCIVASVGFSNALGAGAASCCSCLLGELKQIGLPAAKGKASAETKGCAASSVGWRSCGVLT